MNNSIATPYAPDIDDLLNIIRGMVGEIHPQWKHLLFTPHTHLERDLGLNILARLELCTRIEQALNVSLDKAASIRARTPQELIHYILKQDSRLQEMQETKITATDCSCADSNMSGAFTVTEASNDTTKAGHTNAAACLYNIYALTVFLLLALPTWTLMLITPLEQWRQCIARISSRLFFMSILTPLHVSGQNNLDPNRPQVVVANHTSYLDGFILTASLGIPLHFIVKAELSRILPIRLLLQRFGVDFVDRFNAGRGANAIWRITRKSKNGHTLVFFPEGTFTRFAGLQHFHMGAFVTAARSGVPVVPVAIRGARTVLRGNSWFLQRDRIDVIILPPITPCGNGWKDAARLRDAARSEISVNCGEPDLAEFAPRAK